MRTMYKIINILLFVFSVVLFLPCTQAMQFEGIEPGITSKKAAEKTLGSPDAVLAKNSYRYILKGKTDNIVTYAAYYKNIVDSLEFSFSKITKGQLRKTYGLEKADFAINLKDGAKLECYDFPKGIALLMRGDSDNAPVEKLIYLSPRQYAIHKAISEGAKGKKEYAPREEDALAAASYYQTRALEENRERQYAKALRDARLALEIYPDKIDYVSLLSSIYMNMGKSREAEKLLRKSLKSDPDDPKLLRQLGKVLFKKKKFEESAKYYGKALAANANDTKALNQMSRIRAKQDKFKEALNLIEKALKIEPDNKKYINNKGVWLENLGKKDEALRFYKKAAEIDPGRALYYRNMGRVYKSKGEYDNALEAYKKAVKLNPSKKNIETLKRFKRGPRAKIEKVWVDHNVLEGGQKGMRIHVKFRAYNLLGEELAVCAYIYDPEGKPVPARLKGYRSKDGKAATHKKTKPRYQSSTYSDFVFFFPYAAIMDSPKKGDYRCKTKILYIKKRLLLAKDYFTFHFK